MNRFLIVVVSLALCAFRVYAALQGFDMHTRKMLWFRDGAHLWCGLLIGALLVLHTIRMAYKQELTPMGHMREMDLVEERRWFSIPLAVLIVVELASAIGIPYARAQGWL